MFLKSILAYKLIEHLNTVKKQVTPFYNTYISGIHNELSRIIEEYLKLAKHFDHNTEKKLKQYWKKPTKHKKSNLIDFSDTPNFIKNAERLFEKHLQSIINIIQTLNTVDLELEMLNNASVIFATLSVTGRNQFNDIDKVDVLIVDEAAQAVEAETLIPFKLEPKRCLLVGDTKQLPATVISPKAVKHHFEWSMMCRLIEECKQPYQMLNIQYRMASLIRQWPGEKYYQSKLLDAGSIKTRQAPFNIKENFLCPYSFIDSKKPESLQLHSFRNTQEALLIMKILMFLKVQYKINVQDHVSVITFYAAQKELLKSLAKRHHLNNLKINTVDGFQGDENNIIIISFVRSNRRNNIGFLKDFRRLNVAITRPRFALIMVGNASTLELSNQSDVSLLVKDALNRECVYSGDTIMKYLNNQINEKTQQNKRASNSQGKQRQRGRGSSRSRQQRRGRGSTRSRQQRRGRGSSARGRQQRRGRGSTRGRQQRRGRGIARGISTATTPQRFFTQSTRGNLQQRQNKRRTQRRKGKERNKNFEPSPH